MIIILPMTRSGAAEPFPLRLEMPEKWGDWTIEHRSSPYLFDFPWLANTSICSGVRSTEGSLASRHCSRSRPTAEYLQFTI